MWSVLIAQNKYEKAIHALSQYEKLYGPRLLEIFSVANSYIASELIDGMVAGLPQRALMGVEKLWIVPIILTPKAGGYGEIGAMIIDEKTSVIVGITEKNELFQKAELLHAEKAQAA
ncbi:hypothetical protein L0128_00705 [candidate division KSB1 bacterium]|nr:hypothetical protein [candidate division KSB1 bacterium]